MQVVCPITDKRINESVARLNGLFTVLFVGSFLFLNLWGALVFLAIDFWIRGFVDSKFSLVCQMNKWLSVKLNLPQKMLNAGPKMFAAQVGFILSIAALAAFAFNFYSLSLVIAGILGFFSFLESAFGFCVACKLYPLFRSIK